MPLPALTAETPPPKSISEVTKLIGEKMSQLKALGPLTIHCQWIRPQSNTGATGFFTVILTDAKLCDTSVPGIIWDKPTIAKVLDDGRRHGIDLTARDSRCEVVIDATIDYWAKQNKPYLRIHRLNIVGMTGLKQQAREAAIARLEAEGLLQANRTRPWRHPALRLALITKEGSAACEDTRSILRKSGFAFTTTLFHVSVQGANAEPSILEAFRLIKEHCHTFDAVLLVRGGGGELDLIAYDLYTVAAAVATCPLPVITGLGHQSDHAVCDIVAYRSVETPTAAAQFVVAQLQQFHTTVLETEHAIVAAVTQHTAAVTTALLSISHALIQQTMTAVQHAHRTLFTTTTRILQEHSQNAIHQSQRRLDGAVQAVRLAMMDVVLAPAERLLRRLPRDIHFNMHTVLGHCRASLYEHSAQIDALDPARLMELGFTIVTTLDGRMILDPSSLKPKNRVRIQFQRYDVTATITSIKERLS